jgi:hypothetical protein
MTEDEAKELLARMSAQLHEHFDAVQILVSWNEESDCKCIKQGSGNWYARIGMCREMLLFDEAHINARELADVLNPPDSDELPGG